MREHPRRMWRPSCAAQDLSGRAGTSNTPNRTAERSCCNSRVIITAMATPADRDFVTTAVTPLCAALYEVTTKGRELSEGHFAEHGMLTPDFKVFQTNLARAHVRSLLRKEDLSDWRMVRPGGNAEILLRRGMMTLRILHDHVEDGVPAPGRNFARIDYFRNPDVGIHGVEASRLVGVWTEDKKTDEVIFRIVRPTGNWKRGSPHKADIDFVLPRTGDGISNLEFKPNDEGMTLPFDLDWRGDEDANADGW